MPEFKVTVFWKGNWTIFAAVHFRLCLMVMGGDGDGDGDTDDDIDGDGDGDGAGPK